MIPADLFDAFRVSMGFLVVFGVVPWLMILNSLRKDGLMAHCAAFVQASLFAEVTSLVLGSMHLCLPGSFAAAYALFLFTLMFRSGTLPPFWNPQWLSGQLHHLVVFVDRLPSTLWCLQSIGSNHVNWRKRIDSAAITCSQNIFLFPAFVALVASLYPLHNVRLLTADTYSRALALEKLTFGQPSALDGSVTLLAPVVFLSGCDGATVVRFTAPLFAALLTLTAFAVVFRLTESSPAGLTSAALVAALEAFVNAGQLQAGLASMFWLLSVVLWRASRLDAIWSVGLGLLIDPIPGRDMILHVAIPAVIALLGLSSRSMLRCFEAVRAPVALGAIACLIYMPLKLGGEEGPYEYEAAARAVSRITREFPQNTWLVIAPVQELVFTYGHGWHMQLSEFVNKYSANR